MEEKIDVKIGSKKEALWTTIKEGSEKQILQGEADIEIHKEVIKLAEKKIKEESETFK